MSMKKYIGRVLCNYFPKSYYNLKYLQYKKLKEGNEKKTLEEKKELLNKKYKSVNNEEINWENPKRLSEKIQILKLFNNNLDEHAMLSDKYLNREWVKQKIGEEHLIKLLGVYENFDDIDFNALPNRFVIKCNHDSGSVTVVKDKNKLNIRELRYKYNYFLKVDYAQLSLESHYSLINPKIIIEEYIGDENGELNDYKFWCFDSKVYYCRVDYDRFINHTRNMYNVNWELQDWVEGRYENKKNAPKPTKYSEMVKIAEKLCKGYPEVRVDLYCVNNHIYFGEMTFTSASGFEYIEKKYYLILGNLWK